MIREQPFVRVGSVDINQYTIEPRILGWMVGSEVDQKNSADWNLIYEICNWTISHSWKR